jgi:N-acetylmuramoyl-L-alanine amidase
VLYVSQMDLATRVVNVMAKAGDLVNRHAKFRDDLYFLNNTEEPAILLEVCFVDCETDCDLYRDNFADICEAIARALK